MDRVDILLATYNGERFLKEQIESILTQTYRNFRLLISDDCSTDRTWNILNYYAGLDNRILIHRNERNVGIVNNFEFLLKQVQSEFFMFSDQDDIWTSDKVAVSLEYLKTYACIVSDAYVVDAESNKVLDSFFEYNGTRKGFLKNLLLKNGYTGCCMAFRRELLDKALPFPEDIPMHDIWIGNIAEIFYSFSFVPEKLIRYRRHGSNATMTLRLTSRNSLLKKIFIRVKVLIALLKIVVFGARRK